MRAMQIVRPYLCPFERILPQVPVGSKVLDAGCGGGLVLGLLSAAHRITAGVGFDRSASAVATARTMAASPELGAPLEFSRMDVDGPWPAGPFDAVLLIDLLHHLPTTLRPEVFRRASAALRPGGTLVLKDIGRLPAWKAAGNTLHDLVLARQLVSYSSFEELDRWAADAGIALSYAESPHRLWYSHEIRIYQKLRH